MPRGVTKMALAVLVGLVVSCAHAHAANEAAAGDSVKTAKSTSANGKRDGARAAKSADPEHGEANGTPSVASPAATSKSTARRAEASQPDSHENEPRTLEDINIEGKIAVPQVLFITARDPRRFMGFQHRRYWKSPATIGEETPFPSWIARLAQPPHPATKETSP